MINTTLGRRREGDVERCATAGKTLATVISSSAPRKIRGVMNLILFLSAPGYSLAFSSSMDRESK
jgi:hypothetical protein